MALQTEEIKVCSLCGSTKIQTKKWVYVNTGEIAGEVSEGDAEDNWCEVCEESPTIITQVEFKQINIDD